MASRRPRVRLSHDPPAECLTGLHFSLEKNSRLVDPCRPFGAIAQLGERYTRTVEAASSTLASSTATNACGEYIVTCTKPGSG